MEILSVLKNTLSMKRVIIILVWVIVVAALIFYLVSHAEDIKRLLRLSLYDIALLAVLNIITQFINALKIMFIIRKTGLRLGIKECFSLASVNSVINYLPFKGGAFALAFYFKDKHKLSYMNFINIIVASHLIMISTAALFSSVFIVSHYFFTGIFLDKFFSIFSFLFIITVAAIFFLKRFRDKPASVITKWDKVKEAIAGLNIIFADKVLLFQLVLLNFISVVIIGMRFSVCFRMVSFSAPLLLSLLAGGVKILAMALSIIPSGLGIAELFAGGISNMMDSGANIGVYAAFIDRIVSVIVLLAVGTVSFGYLYKHRNVKSTQT